MVGSAIAINQHRARWLWFFAYQSESAEMWYAVIQMLNLLTDIVEGRGTAETLNLTLVNGESGAYAAGQDGPNPVLSTLKYFRE